MKVDPSHPALATHPPSLRGAASLVVALAWVLAGCTGRVPGTGRPATTPPGVVYETVGVPQQPVVAPATPDWIDSSTRMDAPAPAPRPAAPRPAPAAAAPRPATHVAAPVPPSDSYGPMSDRRGGDGGGSDTGRERQIAILTEAVTALREEIARGYQHSQELLQETKRLRIQVRTLRKDLEKSRDENEKLRAQVRTLERRLGEINVSPPVE